MIELADIFRLHGPEYREKFGDRMLPSHRRAMQDIEQCRTAALGGQVYFCDQCQQERYSYHSCQNRHCPKCGNEQANEWLAQQQQLLLPTHYFFVTFTLPRELRPLARSHQRLLYNLLFSAAAQALLKLAQDPRFGGSTPGLLGVLHTWTRQLLYHPHVHFIVTGGGLTAAGRWRSSPAHFLVPEKPLGIIFRAKLRDGLKRAALYAAVDRRVWKKDWVINCKAVGNGQAACKYLAPYLFRVALSNRRLLSFNDGRVTFAYKDSATGQRQRATVMAQEFSRRFLQHVLPPRFVKLRYYGLLAPANRRLLKRARLLLRAPATAQVMSHNLLPAPPPLLCQHCQQPLTLRSVLARKARAP